MRYVWLLWDLPAPANVVGDIEDQALSEPLKILLSVRPDTQKFGWKLLTGPQSI